MENPTTSASKKIITDCQSVAGELISALHFAHELGQEPLHLHLYHEQTLQEYGTKIALLLQHKVEVFLKKELVAPFQAFLSWLQEKYPMLFCRELAVNVVE